MSAEPMFDPEIAAIDAAIQQQQSTVSLLRAQGHEVTDAERQLKSMLVQREGLRQSAAAPSRSSFEI